MYRSISLNMHTAAIDSPRNRATKALQRRRVMASCLTKQITLLYPRLCRFNYRAAACEVFSAQMHKDQAYYFAQALERLNTLFCEAFEASNYRAAVKAQQELNRLFGLYAA